MRRRLLMLVAFWSALATAQAVILLGNVQNTSAPTGDLANSGWQYQGLFGVYLGTPIAPQFFITAKHVSGAGALFYEGTDHPVAARYHEPFSDLTICQVSGNPFVSIAPLYTGIGEVGQPLVVIGRGTDRGAGVTGPDGLLRGWYWGAGNRTQRWGQNVVADIVSDGTLNQLVYATFDNNGQANEAHLSPGDSGGAVFIQDNGAWKLAGINYAVDGPFYTDAAGGGKFDAALFDASGFYYQDASNPPHFSVVPGPAPAPTGFYASRISSKLGWIYSVIDPGGDVNGNSRTNILDYAASLNAPAPDGPGLPLVTTEAGAVSITYRRLMRAGAPSSRVEKSEDLATWQPVTETPVHVGWNEDVQTVSVQVPTTAEAMFLRVVVGTP